MATTPRRRRSILLRLLLGGLSFSSAVAVVVAVSGEPAAVVTSEARTIYNGDQRPTEHRFSERVAIVAPTARVSAARSLYVDASCLALVGAPMAAYRTSCEAGAQNSFTATICTAGTANEVGRVAAFRVTPNLARQFVGDPRLSGLTVIRRATKSKIDAALLTLGWEPCQGEAQ